LDAGIVLILGQDGVTSGAIYALLALALVLIFSVTRVIFIPQGEFVAFGALTLAMLQAGKVPATVWLLVAMGAVVAVVDWPGRPARPDTEGLGSLLGWNLAYPLALAALLHAWSRAACRWRCRSADAGDPGAAGADDLPHRLPADRRDQRAGAADRLGGGASDPHRAGAGVLRRRGRAHRAVLGGQPHFGEVSINLQTLWVVGCSLAFIVGLAAFFTRSLYGKALRATAVNPPAPS
jgi:branched-chain amino acid transport system permease protein